MKAGTTIMATYRPTYRGQIENEVRAEQQNRTEWLAKLQNELERITQWKEIMTLEHERPDCKLTEKQKAKALDNALKEFRKKSKEKVEEIKNFQKTMERAPQIEDQRLRDEAADWFRRANEVARNSGKNKLYLGNRIYVGSHAKSKDGIKKKKDRRCLDAGLWTWGLNLAWIEGGIVAGATFKIKFNASEEFVGFPEGSLDEMRENPTMSSQEWVDLCRKYPGTLLWYNDKGEDRPSWFAKEVEAALDAGYRFNFSETKQGDTKLTLESN